jgi:hypothetical protein
VQKLLQNFRNLTTKPQQQVESVRERESDGLKDGEASLYTQRERSRTTQSARPVTTRVFGTVGIGCPGGSRHSDNLRTESRSNRFRDLEFVEIEGHPSSRLPICCNRVATDFETSDSLESRSNRIQDLEFVGIEGRDISRPRICWNGFPIVPTGITIVWTVGARVAKGIGKLQPGAERGKKILTSLVAGYDHPGGIQGRL